ncbi:MAG: presqualene diphosphate synthase HpnD [Chthoniobacteraceae bacterium]
MTQAENITRASGSNLALAFIALPRERRRDMSTFYAFCRLVDDIVDEPAPRAEKEAALATWRQAVRAATPGESPLAGPVRALIDRYGLPVAHFDEIITGMEMDLDGASYATWEDLRLYCHRVASVVGLVSLAIFGAREPAAEDYALNLGLAFQLTNILRDVGQDFANGGRIYLPREDMMRFGVTREDIASGRRSESFLSLMDFESTRASGFYRAALAARPASDRKALVAAEIMRAVYSRLLEKMRGDRWRVFDRRYSLGKLTKLWLVLRGWLGLRG